MKHSNRLIYFITRADEWTVFFYGDVGSTFLRTVFDANIIGQSYAYDWIPSYSVLALTVLEFGTVLYNRHKNGSAKTSVKK